MRRKQVFAVALTLAVVLFVFAPVGTAAAQDGQEIDDLSVDVSEDGVVTVTANETGVENATIEVELDDENASYDGTGTHTNVTDENGEFELPEPDEEVAVTVTATADGASDTDSATLVPTTDLAVDVTQSTDATVTVTDGDEAVKGATVDVETADGENASYADTGTYETDENGTVSLDAPIGNESVDIVVTATDDGATAETTATLEPLSEVEVDDFGALVSQFVDQQRNETDGPLGLAVAGFVVENNPGNAPDHAGPPDSAGPPSDDDERTQGPPEHAGQSDDKEQGPPDHAGPSGGDDDDSDDDDDDDDDDDGNKGNGGGPPNHAGPN